MTQPEAKLKPDSRHPSSEFCLWMLSMLGLVPQLDNDGTYRVDMPSERSLAFDGFTPLRFVLDTDKSSVPDDADFRRVQLLAPGSPLFDQVASQLQADRAVHAVPVRQPVNVHEFASCLFDAFTIEGGQVHLAGCTLEDRPIVRLTYLVNGHGHEPGQLRHCYAWPNGEPLESETAEMLHLRQLGPLPPRSVRVSDSDVARWVAAARSRAEMSASKGSAKWLLASVIWCKYALGKLSFSSGERSAELAFEGWATAFAEGVLKPPPFRCGRCGRESYQLGVTDDGCITVADGIAVCAESGKRVMEVDLETCAITGKRALSQYLQTCPITGARVLRDAMKHCRVCRQAVNPEAIRGGRCLACRRLRPIRKDATIMARVLAEYPGLDRCSKWQLSETSVFYVLVGRTMSRKVLVVVDKATFEVTYLAVAGRWWSSWCEVPAEQANQYLE